MIEIMCRDGKESQEELEKIANMVYQATGIETNVIDERDRRAMLFWGPEDVSALVSDLKITSLDSKNLDECDNFLAGIEPKMHMAMLDAGHDTLFDELCDYAEANGEELNFN